MDRAFVNALWYDVFDFSQVVYMANSLSDHSAVIIDTPKCPRPSPTFHFRDMWTRDVAFFALGYITTSYQPPTRALSKPEMVPIKHQKGLIVVKQASLC